MAAMAAMPDVAAQVPRKEGAECLKAPEEPEQPLDVARYQVAGRLRAHQHPPTRCSGGRSTGTRRRGVGAPRGPSTTDAAEAEAGPAARREARRCPHAAPAPAPRTAAAAAAAAIGSVPAAAILCVPDSGLPGSIDLVAEGPGPAKKQARRGRGEGTPGSDGGSYCCCCCYCYCYC